MSDAFLTTILVILFIAVIGVGIAALVLRENLIECETTESPYCLQYICPSGQPATRTDSGGNTMMSI